MVSNDSILATQDVRQKIDFRLSDRSHFLQAPDFLIEINSEFFRIFSKAKSSSHFAYFDLTPSLLDVANQGGLLYKKFADKITVIWRSYDFACHHSDLYVACIAGISASVDLWDAIQIQQRQFLKIILDAAHILRDFLIMKALHNCEVSMKVHPNFTTDWIVHGGQNHTVDYSSTEFQTG